jgi:hypothetical protein
MSEWLVVVLPLVLIVALIVWLAPLWVPGGTMWVKVVVVPALRFCAAAAFVIAAFDLQPFLPIGLALWCISTLFAERTA